MMAYKDKFVAVVKCNGKNLRERKNEGEMFITLPFGAEYTLLFKNLHSRRAVVQVEIDGVDVLSGHELVVHAHLELELEGFMEALGRRATAGFKFIQKTKEISDARGDKVDDGMITISFAFEESSHRPIFVKSDPCPWTKPIKPWRPREPRWKLTYGGDTTDGDHTILRSKTLSSDADGSSCLYSSSVSTCDSASLSDVKVTNTSSFDGIVDEQSAPLDDEGITVHGSDVNQQFNSVHVGPVGNYETIVLRLRGVTASGKQVKKAVTTKTKVKCPTCGRRSRSHIKFCNNCGTNIQAATA